ncbi:MAG: major facilitator transporter [Pseudonocardia sp.]|jgi:putative MFS transporter|uniref:MFS transporter n=1 Tax=Pseudonocardia sp. TaxID=60912 RepID=UPI00262EFF10|nr:MFS transporter [Pseudonocardia sp.]MCU1628099.1 major facilitator transporter [Pseudonocardia sp.]
MRTGDQVVQDLPWKWGVQGRIFVIGGLGYMFDAWDVSLNGFLTPLLGTEFGLGTGQRGLVATANLIGMAVGAIAWGTIADRMGRKKAFSITLMIFALFSVLGALSPSWEVFLVLRFLAGVGLGGCIPVDYAIVSEFSPRKQRGRVLAAMDGWWPIGTTLAGVTATFLVPVTGNWRWMLALMVLPAILLVWIRRGVPESPIYLARTGREAEARAVIDDMVARTGATPEPYEIPAVVPEATASRKKGLAAAVDQLRLVWAFNPKVTGVAWALFISVMVVYYAALSWMPSILRAQGMGEVAAFGSTTVMNAVGILGVITSVVLVEVVGRKWVIGVAAPLAALSLLVFSLVLGSPTAAIVMIAVFGFFALVVIPVMYAYVSELYPTELRASGFGWASSMSRAVTGFVPLIFGSLLWPVLGLPLTFALMGVVVLGAVLYMALAAPETKGRELDRIVGSEDVTGAEAPTTQPARSA